jgi:hypothetical protein
VCKLCVVGRRTDPQSRTTHHKPAPSSPMRTVCSGELNCSTFEAGSS